MWGGRAAVVESWVVVREGARMPSRPRDGSCGLCFRGSKRGGLRGCKETTAREKVHQGSGR